MNIQDLGSIGEMVAAVATILTLIYLALQIKTSNTLAKAQSMRELINPPLGHSLAVAESSELADIIRKGLDDFDSLDASQQFRFHQWMLPLFSHTYTIWAMRQMDLMTDDNLNGYLGVIVAIMNSKGGTKYWTLFKTVTNQETVEAFEKAQREIGKDVPPIQELLPFLAIEGDT